MATIDYVNIYHCVSISCYIIIIIVLPFFYFSRNRSILNSMLFVYLCVHVFCYCMGDEKYDFNRNIFLLLKWYVSFSPNHIR